MSRDFDQLVDDIEQEARRAGPEATAEYATAGATHHLARQVFDLRKAARLTQRQLAAKSGVQQADISRIEAGDANPTLATIAALAYALGVEITLESAKPRKVTTPRATPKRYSGARRLPVRAAARRRAKLKARFTGPSGTAN
jgi:transcriptional regulator with XRE-family HTH domain